MVKPLYKTAFNCRAWWETLEIYYCIVSYVWLSIDREGDDPGKPRENRGNVGAMVQNDVATIWAAPVASPA